ncbi:hypothetical protein BDM02DRAFT_3109404 [Thelephora ganbajun]|uniref:Uncharacterized protein n=1 Tax=Thelephora ganbajun TaxID=370292 RepID=A0ACB6ZSG0_THEGA|nr:hypothetical protein BDM02DRAFT_3109404 [Thelephora ganbajun]
MGKDINPVSAQVTRDHFSGFLCYTISQGTTMSHTKVSSQPPPIPELPNSLMGSPSSSQSSWDTSDTGSSPGACVDRRVDEDYLPLQMKDPKLQAYFFLMERALRTCHPAALHAEALNLTQDIVAKPTDVASSIRAVAETLAKAGYRKVEYSRSCALIAREVSCQLQSTSHDASVSFKNRLISAVMEVFDKYYLKVNLWHLGGLNGLDSVEEKMINVAAFAGDLFALDLLPVKMVHDSIIANLAYANQVSTVHCRALHLFLLHARTHIGPSIKLEILSNVRRQLIRCTRGPPIAYDRMAQLWVIECCTVIDQTIEQDRLACQDGGKPAAVSHQWDMVLSKNGWFSALIS